ncbi:MAG: lipid-A-disaccharide synthase [Nitrospiraceae bacterium]
MPRVLIVTGEASGDLHGANLARALTVAKPDIDLIGVGGPHMAAAGVPLLQGLKRLDHMGLAGLSVLKTGYDNYKLIADYVQREPVDAVVLVDNSGMNLRLARVAKGAGRRVIYYVAPQIWASRPYRMRTIRQAVDLVLAIFPFEPALYAAAGVACTFVGHPLLDQVGTDYPVADLRRQFGLRADGPVIGLLPGSRLREVDMLLPPMLEAAARLRDEFPASQYVLAQASSIARDVLDRYLAGTGLPVTVIEGQPSEVMAVADVLMVASGTATLQAAIVGTPMVLTYKTTWLTYQVARRVITLKWIGLVNILANREVVPELIQYDATGARLHGSVGHLLRDTGAYEKMKQALREVRVSLGAPGASARAAQAVLDCCTT